MAHRVAVVRPAEPRKHHHRRRDVHRGGGPRAPQREPAVAGRLRLVAHGRDRRGGGGLRRRPGGQRAQPGRLMAVAATPARQRHTRRRGPGGVEPRLVERRHLPPEGRCRRNPRRAGSRLPDHRSDQPRGRRRLAPTAAGRRGVRDGGHARHHHRRARAALAGAGPVGERRRAHRTVVDGRCPGRHAGRRVHLRARRRVVLRRRRFQPDPVGRPSGPT